MNELTHEAIAKTVQPASRPHVFLWLQRRRWTLVWLAAMGVLVAAQWPIFKGLAYSALGVPAPADGITWRSDYAAALAESAKTGKPILLDFHAAWCPPCQAMKRDAWPDAKVRELANGSYIPVALDIDVPGAGAVATRYQVDSIPRIIIIDAQQTVLKTGAFMTRDALVEFLASKTKAK